jgi:hypothetical protein
LLTQLQFYKIKEISLTLRSEILNGEFHYYDLTDFPEGCCGLVSERFLLPRLIEAGFQNIQYISECVNTKGQSHAWLEY